MEQSPLASEIAVAPPAPAPVGPVPSPSRPVVEFLVVLLVGVTVARAFAAEAYVVPTGSMAPTLLGMHRDYTCPACRFRFALGVDEQGRSGRPVCPNCGNAEFGAGAGVEGNGDRLLVQKFVFDFRPPRRWECAVFQNPDDAGQAYVKRVVGLPGEAVEVRRGDVWIDGRIARKGLAEQRAMRLLVYDHDFPPRDAARFPRWGARRGGLGRPLPTGWSPRGSGFVHRPTGDDPDRADWLEYHHWQPERAAPGPVRDFTPYNGSEAGGDHRVEDLMLEAQVSARTGCRAIVVRLCGEGLRYDVTVPVDAREPLAVRRNGRLVPAEARGGGLASSPAEAPRFARVEASWMDRRLTVAIDGRLLFDPIDDDLPGLAPPGFGRPLALGVLDGGAEVRGLKVYRDIYYTDALAGAPRRPFGVGEPYRLGPGEYFVLGDNSPVSNDSRFWANSPVVRADQLLGKPFLVHLPSQAVPLKVFGRDLYWIPDPREIRYIR